MAHAPMNSSAALAEKARETRAAIGLLICVVLTLAVTAIATALWGAVALTMVGLAGTVFVLLMLTAYAAGF